MSLDFAIIPITNLSLSNAYDIQAKLTNGVKLQLNIMIDQNYDISTNSRVNSWKKKGYDIITVDNDYQESHSIVVRFSDKGSKAEVMEINEFVELVASYEDEDDANVLQNIEERTSLGDVNKISEGCTIM
jgi:hypothetical protein